MLTNAVAGGVLGAAYLAVLVLQLNPQVPTGSITAVRWFGTLVMFYGLYLSVAVYAAARHPRAARLPLAVARMVERPAAGVARRRRSRRRRPVITWANLKGFRAMLSDAAAERLRQGAIGAHDLRGGPADGGDSPLFVRPPRHARPPPSLLVAAMVAVGGHAALAARSRASWRCRRRAVRAARRRRRRRGPAPPHVRLLAPRRRGAAASSASGSRPASCRTSANLLDRGAAIDLATLKPTQADAGLGRGRDGQISAEERHPVAHSADPAGRRQTPSICCPTIASRRGSSFRTSCTEDEYTSASLRARPMWEILADYRLASGVLNWPRELSGARRFRIPRQRSVRRRRRAIRCVSRRPDGRRPQRPLRARRSTPGRPAPGATS